jgi:hypothetical protein
MNIKGADLPDEESYIVSLFGSARFTDMAFLFVTFREKMPVDRVPKILYTFWTGIPAVDAIGVFPDITGQYRKLH